MLQALAQLLWRDGRGRDVLEACLRCSRLQAALPSKVGGGLVPVGGLSMQLPAEGLSNATACRRSCRLLRMLKTL